jgi:hypothetical protein
LFVCLNTQEHIVYWKTYFIDEIECGLKKSLKARQVWSKTFSRLVWNCE